MKYESIIKPATIVDYSTLFSILEKTIKDIFDPINLFNNIHVYTHSIFNLRIIFLEPFLKQVIRDTPSVLSALLLRQNLELNYKQAAYITLQIQNSKEIAKWIGNVNDNKIPQLEYFRDKDFYDSINLLNETTHNSQNSFSRNQFIEAFYHCFTLYSSTFPEASPQIKFVDIVSIEKYISNTLKEMIVAKENEYKSILTALKSIEKQNEELNERTKENSSLHTKLQALEIQNVELNRDLKNNLEKIEREKNYIESLRLEKANLEKRIGQLQIGITTYLNLKKDSINETDKFVEILIKKCGVSWKAMEEYNKYKNVSLEAEKHLKITI